MAKKSRVRLSGDMQINISSLMDIMTILLIFLILNFDSQESKVTAPDGFDVPSSTSQATVKLAVKVSIAKDSLRVEDRSVLTLKGGKIPKSALNANQQIKQLLSALQKEKARLEQGSVEVGKEEEKEVVYLEADKEITYDIIDRVLKTAAAAGFAKFRLAVHREG